MNLGRFVLVDGVLIRAEAVGGVGYLTHRSSRTSTSVERL